MHDRFKQALSTIEEATLAAASSPPSEPSVNGFRRVHLRVPVVRKMVKAGYPFLAGLARADAARTWHYIFQNTQLYEVAHQAIYYYQYKTLNKTEFNTLRQWINRCDCWEHSDDLSKIYADTLEANPDWVLPWFRKWNDAANPWKRRQSMVGLLEYAIKRKRILPFDVLISFVEPLLDDDDYYVGKGVGWTLREIYNCYPDETLAFMRQHIARITPNGYSAATEKLDKATKAEINALRKQQRGR